MMDSAVEVAHFQPSVSERIGVLPLPLPLPMAMIEIKDFQNSRKA